MQKTTQRTMEMREGSRDDERGLYWGIPKESKDGNRDEFGHATPGRAMGSEAQTLIVL